MSTHRNKIRKAAIAASVALAAVLAGCSNNPSDNANATNENKLGINQPTPEATQQAQEDKNTEGQPLEEASDLDTPSSSPSTPQAKPVENNTVQNTNVVSTENNTRVSPVKQTVNTQVKQTSNTNNPVVENTTDNTNNHNVNGNIIPVPDLGDGSIVPIIPEKETSDPVNSTEESNENDNTSPSVDNNEEEVSPNTEETNNPSENTETTENPSDNNPMNPGEGEGSAEIPVVENPDNTVTPVDPAALVEARVRVEAARAALVEAEARANLTEEGKVQAEADLEVAQSELSKAQEAYDKAVQELNTVREMHRLRVSEARDAWEEAKVNLEKAQLLVSDRETALENARLDLERKTRERDAAVETENKATKAYNNAVVEKSNLETRISGINSEIARLESDISTRNGDVAVLRDRLVELSRERDSLSASSSSEKFDFSRLSKNQLRKTLSAMMADWFNEYRRQAGFAPLLWSEEIAERSAGWSTVMMNDYPSKHDIDHSEKGGAYRPSTSGENILMFSSPLFDTGYYAPGTDFIGSWENIIDKSMELWKHSKGHNTNFFNVNYVAFGIGVDFIYNEKTGVISFFATWQATTNPSAEHIDTVKPVDSSTVTGIDVKPMVEYEADVPGSQTLDDVIARGGEASYNRALTRINNLSETSPEVSLLETYGVKPVVSNAGNSERVAELDAEISDINNQISALEEQLKVLEGDKESREADINQAQAELEALKTRVGELETARNEAVQNVAEANDHVETAQENLTAIENGETVDVAEAESKVTETRDAYNEALAQETDAVNEAEKTANAAEVEKVEAENNVREAQEAVEEAKQADLEADNKVTRARSELDQAVTEEEELKALLPPVADEGNDNTVPEGKEVA